MKLMKRLNPKEAIAEIDCPACNGTGFPKMKHGPTRSQDISTALRECFGKGRIAVAR
jgi:DnaJ-class molecular chaperone